MFNLGKIIKKKDYENIDKLFNINEIKDGYVQVQGKDMKRIYIYKIQPVTLLNITIEMKEQITSLYKEFLREMNFDFEILIRNKELNVDEYLILINTGKEDKNVSMSEYSEYLLELENALKEEKIYIREYYLVVSLYDNYSIKISELDRVIYKLANIGCSVIKVDDKSSIEKIMYECINKENLKKGIKNEK